MRLLVILLSAALFTAAASATGETNYNGEQQSSPVVSTLEDAVKFVAEQKKEEKKKLKIAIFAPYMYNSQVIWNKRVGEELMKAGHDVTIYMMYFFEADYPKIDIDPRIRVIPVNGSTGMDGAKMMREQTALTFNDPPFWDSRIREAAGKFMELLPKSCELFIKNKEFLAHIEDSRYDIAFTHVYNLCPIGIIHRTKIPTWIWLISAALTENVADLMGVPVPPSYCAPIMMDAGEQMTFYERIKSFTGHALMKAIWKRMMYDKEAAAPLVMVNSNELYDFARPTLAKIVNIGGVGIRNKEAQPLKPELAIRIEKANAIVVMSFGAVAPMYLMPEDWKEAYFNAFTQFPDAQFFLRYEKPEEIAKILPRNAYAAKWLPQTDLLLHPKALGLISHGGYNSIQDVLHAGVPIMATALFADQARSGKREIDQNEDCDFLKAIGTFFDSRNAHLVERLGMGIYVPKTTISKESVANGVRRLIEDRSLKINAQRIKAMITTKPVSSETLLVKWTEFLSEHKQLDILVPYGTQLSFFVYHSLDVIVFLSAITLSILVLFFFIIRCSLRCCGFCKKSVKVDEKKKLL